MPEWSQRPHCHHFWVDSDPVIPVRRCGFKACGEDDIRLAVAFLWIYGVFVILPTLLPFIPRAIEGVSGEAPPAGRMSCQMVQRGVRGRAGVIGIETRVRPFGPKSRACGVDAALVPHHLGFRGLQIAHASQSAVDPVARPQSTRLVPL